MDTILLLCNCYFLDSDYNHTVNFNSKANQISFFNQHVVYQINDTMYQRKKELVIRVDKSLSDLKNCNYMVSINSNGERFYYFILEKEYNSDYSSTLYLQLDLIQTYLFDINFKECLIDRCHQARWNDTTPNYNIEDEFLDVGEYELKNSKVIYDYRGKGTYIISSSERLGKGSDERANFSSGGGSGSGTTSSNSQNYKNGYMDEVGLWLLKCNEGYCSSAYYDTNGYATIGYGITQASYPSEYNSLMSSCTEQKASEIMGDVAYNFSSQVRQLCIQAMGESWLNQWKLNALTSYAYQYGVEGLQNQPIWTDYITKGKSDTEIYNYYKTITPYSDRRKREAEMFIGNPTIPYYITDWSTMTYVTTNGGKGHIPNEYK